MATTKAEKCYGEIVTERDWKAYELEELIDLLTPFMYKKYQDETDEQDEEDDSDKSDALREREEYNPDREA